VLVYVDADCRAPRNWLEHLARAFEGPHPPAAVTGPYRFYDWDIIGRVMVRLYDYTVAPLPHVLAQYVFGIVYLCAPLQVDGPGKGVQPVCEEFLFGNLLPSPVRHDS
jgi:hypothetical protein